MCAKHSSRNSGLIIGLVVLMAGVLLFVDRLGLLALPWWLFTWPMILIVIGFVVGASKGFRSVEWVVLMLIGLFFIIDDVPGWEYIRPYSLSLGLITIGLFIIFRSSLFISLFRSQKDERMGDRDLNEIGRVTEIFGADEQKKGSGSAEEYVDLTSIFGGIKRRIFSKSFKGGDITNFFGGTELDLTQADIEGRIKLDVVQVFGSMKLMVPSNWVIKSDLTTIFGGIEDKRSVPEITNANKVVVLDGVCIFGGVEIKSF